MSILIAVLLIGYFLSMIISLMGLSHATFEDIKNDRFVWGETIILFVSCFVPFWNTLMFAFIVEYYWEKLNDR